MTTKRIIITKTDGSVTVRVPCAGDRRRFLVDPGKPATFDKKTGKQLTAEVPPTFRDETDDEFLARVSATPVHHGEVFSMAVVDASEVPPKDEFRAAWTFDGKAFGHDMAKARELHREKIRRERKPHLEAADIALMRAIETGADTKAIAAEKQRLRDAPANPAIDAAKTIEDLKRITL